MQLTKKMLTSVVAFAMLVTLMSASAFAVPLDVQGQLIMRLSSAAGDQALPLDRFSNLAEVRLRSADPNGQWSLQLDRLLFAAGSNTAPGSDDVALQSAQRFRAWVEAPPVGRIETWGNGAGGPGALSDPAGLVVLGSRGERIYRLEGVDNATSAGETKVRTGFNLLGGSATMEYFRPSGTSNTIDVLVNTALGTIPAGVAYRGTYRNNTANNSTTIVGFAEIPLEGISLGVSAGMRSATGVTADNTAFGVVGKTELGGMGGGSTAIQAEYVSRGANFFNDQAKDAGFQRDRFKQSTGNATGNASVMEIIGTWRGAGDTGLNVRTILHPTSEGELNKLKGPAIQAIYRTGNDAAHAASAQSQMLLRGGSKLADNLWGVLEYHSASDTAGVPSGVLGIAGTNVTRIRGNLRYNLAGTPLNDWFFLGQLSQMSDGSLSANSMKGELWYDKGNVRQIFGYSTGTDTANVSSASLYSETRVKF